jgi:RNA polymerase sigma factor (sigma-70 family)
MKPLTAEARDLAERHVPLARQMVWWFLRRHAPRVPVDELAGVADFGLVYAAGKFLPELGVPFRSFAAMVIRQRLTRFAVGWRRQDLAEASALSERRGEPAHGPDVGELAEARELCLRILGRLTPASARAVWLVLAEGLSYREAGARLGVSPQRVYQLVGRAVAATRERIGEPV